MVETQPEEYFFFMQLMQFTLFRFIFHVFDSISCILQYSPIFYRILVFSTVFFYILLCLPKFYCILLYSTTFSILHSVLLYPTAFYCVLLRFTVFSGIREFGTVFACILCSPVLSYVPVYSLVLYCLLIICILYRSTYLVNICMAILR
jgi:hypothetical protein